MIPDFHSSPRNSGGKSLMRVLTLALLCVVLCSCERDPTITLGGAGDEPGWLSAEATRRAGEQLIAERYPQAQIVSEIGMGQTFTYRFATNGTNSPLSAVVDRKTGKARFEKPSPNP